MYSILSLRKNQSQAIARECGHAQLKAEYHDFWDKIPFSQRLLFGDHTADKEPKWPWALDCISTENPSLDELWAHKVPSLPLPFFCFHLQIFMNVSIFLRFISETAVVSDALLRTKLPPRCVPNPHSSLGYRLPRHQGDSPPANSPPRNNLATKRSLLATNHQ